MSNEPRPTNRARVDPPALSVVIPTRDRAEAVTRAVASVLTTNSSNVEVVVSDDGSADDTVARVRAIGDPRISLVVAERSAGANRARNRGAAVAAAPVIAFLDSDDAFLPGRIDRLMAVFGAHPKIDCLVDGFVDHAAGRTTTHRMPGATPDPPHLRHMLIAHQVPLTNSAITIRRRAFDAIGGFDETLKRHQDRDLLLRLLAAHRVAFGGAIDVDKFRSPESISHDFEGYIAGLDAFVGRLAEASDPRYEDLFRYLATRGILKAIAQGHWAAALHEVRQAARTEHLPKGFVRSLLRYNAGRRFRLNSDLSPRR